MNLTDIFQGFKNFENLERAIFSEHLPVSTSARFIYKEQYFYTNILR